MKLEFIWHPYRYFPYEKVLARRELASLITGTIKPGKSGLVVETNNGWKQHCSEPTYFREVLSADGNRFVPLQARLEASANGKPIRRQSTRYSAHGLHEYRGKFNPQIVRAIGNIVGLRAGNWVFDPFSGSGTTLLEAAHAGWNAIGTDLNPLAVEIANAKLAAIRMSSPRLRAYFEMLRGNLPGNLDFRKAFLPLQIEEIGGPSWMSGIPSIHYLRQWFTESVLVQLALVLRKINELPHSIRSVFRVALSDVVRDVSLQDPGDLRIRRRKDAPQNFPVIPLFLESLSRKLELITKAREHLGTLDSKQTALLQDVRCIGPRFGRALPNGGCFDAVITSPPYATALPYIDTQRLSLVMLGLVSSDAIRNMERKLVGNREIANSERMQLEYAVRENVEGLPRDCVSFCQELLAAVGREDGFRRQNVPGLIYKYFVDMSKAFEQIHSVMKAGGSVAMLIGPNSTTLGGHEFVVDTPNYLVSIATLRKFKLRERIRFETYQRFHVHKANSIKAETLLLFETR